MFELMKGSFILLCVASTAVIGGTPKAGRPTPPPVAEHQTKTYRIQLDAYLIKQGPTSAAITVNGLQAVADSLENFDRHLHEAGPVQKIASVDREVDFPAKLSMTLGARLPMPSGRGQMKDGTMTTSVSYHEAGVIFEIVNSVVAENGAVTADFEFEASTITDSKVAIQGDTMAPVIESYKENVRMTLTPGRPRICTMLAVLEPKDGERLLVLRYLLKSVEPSVPSSVEAE